MEHGTFFFLKFKIMQWNGGINKQKQTREVFYKKRCSKKFHKFHRKMPVFFNKVSGLRKKKNLWHRYFPVNFTRPATLLKKKLWYRYFPVNFAKFLRTLFLQNTSGRLLLNKEAFLNLHLIKVSKLLVFVFFSFFIISNIMVKIFFQE